MGLTSIEWTDESTNPIRARLRSADGNQIAVGHHCEKISPGCKNCYSSRMQPRFRMPQFQEQRRADVEHFLDVTKLADVLSRRKPTKFFWCDMTDMFGDWVPDEWIAAVFGVMAATPQHTHQVLTKRAERLPRWFEWLAKRAADAGSFPVGICAALASQWLGRPTDFMPDLVADWPRWPLPGVWIGVSAENQETADERIPYLLKTPAAVKFVSAEPLLGPIDLFGRDEDGGFGPGWHLKSVKNLTDYGTGVEYDVDAQVGIDWVIIGSESGQKARPMDVLWARSIADQCIAVGVPVFTKQIATPAGRAAGNRKGGDPAHWPAGEWPRQFPDPQTT